MAISPGTTLGPYEILTSLGAGGMGEVYQARDTRLDRTVAVKVLPAHLTDDPEARGRFEREARAVAALSHPNILSIYDLAEDSNTRFAVMEFLDGETLRQRMNKGPLGSRRAVEIAIAIAEGLAAAHAKGILHRDIKPENIFLTNDGQVKILDFGLARVDRRGEKDVTLTNVLTTPGLILGTVSYMSPEHVTGRNLNPASDIFSLGSVLHEMVTGRHPFARPTAAETMAAILRDPAPEPSWTSSGYSPSLDRIIGRCLEKLPEQRYQSARDLAFHLREVLAGSDPRIAAPASQHTDSIAVLPFSTLGGSADSDYLGDGIAESILNSLSQLPKLRVVPRSLAFQFKGREVELCEIGRRLNARTLLTGHVLLRGEALQIQAEMIDVESQSQLWGERFRGRFQDIFEAEEQIAKQIVEKLKLRLSGTEQELLTQRATHNPEAYRQYLRGLAFWHQSASEVLRPAVQCFESAIRLDPEFGSAYVGLALVYSWMGHWQLGLPRDYYRRAKEAIEKALSLDDTLADAHMVAAEVRLFHDFDWASADYHSRRALELNPELAPACQARALVLLTAREFERAVSTHQRAMELDPLSSVFPITQAIIRMFTRHYDEALGVLRRVLQQQPNHLLGLLFHSALCSLKGEHEEAITVAKRVAEMEQRLPWRDAMLARAYACAGLLDEAARILSTARTEASPYEFAQVQATLGRSDDAFASLELALQNGSWRLAFFHLDPLMDPLKSDTRFEALVHRVGIAPGARSAAQAKIGS